MQTINTNLAANLDNLFEDLMEGFAFDSVNKALAQIKEQNLNRMRCILTGAPYATVDDSEVRLALMGYVGERLEVPVDELLDKWDLNLLAMCSKVGPAFMNRKTVTLKEMIREGSVAGYARLLTFYLTRFFYSFDHFGQGMSSQRSIERLHFAIDWHDFFMGLDVQELRVAAFRLASDDGWLNLGLWKQLGLFHVRARTNGIITPEFSTLRQATFHPDGLPVTLESFHGLMDDLTTLMIRSEALGLGPAHIAPPNQESISIAQMVADLLGIENKAVEITAPAIPLNPETAAEAEMWAEYTERVTGRKVKLTYSAIHGPGFAPGEKGRYRAKAAKPATESKPKAEKPIKAKIAKPRTEKQRKLNDLIGKINFNLTV